jgi:hypothetical protein
MPPDSITMIGMLVGFLVVGVIGIYVGGQLIGTMNATAIPGDPTGAQISTILPVMELGMNLTKVLVIISIVAIVFVLLQRGGLVPGPSRRSQRYGLTEYDQAPQPQTPARTTMLRSRENSSSRDRIPGSHTSPSIVNHGRCTHR